jgi:glycosyltransferase involved in cell wall biosynthesis
VRVTHLIHDLRPGGAEHLLVDLAANAGASGLDVSIVSMRPLADHRFAAALQESGVPLHSLDLSGWWDLRGPSRLRRILPELRPDVVHSHLKHADAVAGRVARSEGIPHVSTLHLIEDAVGIVARRKRDLGTRSRIRTAARTVAVSDAVRRWYLGATSADPDTVVTIHNGVPDHGDSQADSDAIRAELGIAPDAVVVVMVAVMRPGKGHDTLMDALAQIQDPSVAVLLVGDGPESERLRQRGASDSRVVFAGYREDVSEMLSAADVVVHPSRRDAFPTALLHALASGTAIVGSDVEGIPEIVTPEVGVLVPPGEPALLAGALRSLLTDRTRREELGLAARSRYEARFTAKAWADRLHALYVELLVGT